VPFAAYSQEWPRVAQVAQLVEQRIENPRVGGSIPSLGTISFQNDAWLICFI
jgi:hypothetical protein